MLSNTFSIILLLTVSAIGPLTASPTEGFWAKSIGDREKMLKTGDLSGVISLSELAKVKSLYALGPVAPLKGEITIYGDEISISTVVDNKPSVSQSLDKEAIFLLYASAPRWRTFPVERDLEGLDDVERFISAQIKKNNLSTESTFPFRIEGHSVQTDYHIIFKENNAKHSKQEHRRAKRKFILSDQTVKVLGFWVQEDLIGKLTHPGSRTHLHVISKDGLRSGHVDDIKISKGSTLFFPEML